MQDITVEPFSIPDNNALYTGHTYQFTSAFYLEFGEVHSEDNAESTSSGHNQFRIDHTRIGRYECEFLDHTFGYRSENEVTLLATPRGPEWAIKTSIPSGVYHGCSIVVLLDRLGAEDHALFEKLGIGFGQVIEKLDVDQRWQKFSGGRLAGLFDGLYSAHAAAGKELVYLKALEILLHFAQMDGCIPPRNGQNEFFPAAQVKAAKDAHAYILSHYAHRLVFEALVKNCGISYSSFNRVFKAIFGDTPYQYLKRLRINHAARLLLETDLSILDIAGRVGYTNQSQFSAAFQSIMGALPSTFRKEKIEMG